MNMKTGKSNGFGIWKEKEGYKSLRLFTVSWWACSPKNIKLFYGHSHFNIQLMGIGFNKYNKGWELRLFALQLVWVG
tara:strand:+ start:162 stop:392 length:231 start_codon:yes stop_codon:yes gene_type:complete